MEQLPYLSTWRRALPRIGLDEASDIAPRRLAEMLAFAGERFAAADAYREILLVSPADSEVLEKLAFVLQRVGRFDEERAILRRLAELTADELGVPPEHREEVIAFELASHGALEPPPAAPRAFVAARFDVFAETFDSRLRATLHYVGPERILERLERTSSRTATLDICDVGCGTGVLGPMLRPFARSLGGVDLSPKMLEKARARGVYDTLDQAELTEHLLGRPRAFDVITAADVLVCIGDLGPAFGAVHGALRDEGHFDFTVERTGGDGYDLSRTGRYSHSEPYVRASARVAGLTVVSLEEAELRREQGLPVMALIGVLRRD